MVGLTGLRRDGWVGGYVGGVVSDVTQHLTRIWLISCSRMLTPVPSVPLS